ncbi:sulfite exporter TauE/SafE family protein [Chrysiogenes arsenatis]|uniref:sulfite exporter TauE/SafE family protein n=1 Tax=Chrysiogenes arsenatis TaxID=309797 RepID=UPI0003FE14FA|nr:sulfite exporter TauE/SafE family protein [Chrysiogenes arsenatis]
MDFFSPEIFLWTLAIVGVAALIHGALGIGFPMVGTPLIALLTDVQTAILVTLIPNIAINIISIRNGGNWRSNVSRHWLLPLTMVIGSALGTLLLVHYNSNTFRLILAGALFFYLFTVFFPGRISWSFIRKFPRSSMVGFGLFGGTLGGAVNVSGPIILLYLLESGLTTVAMIQVLNLSFLAGKLIQTITFGALGKLSFDLLTISAPLLLVAIGGVTYGQKVRSRFSATVYRKALYCLLGIVACMLLGQFIISN